MRNISTEDTPGLIADVDRVLELARTFSVRRTLRDPIAVAVEELHLTPGQVHSIFSLGNEGELTMGALARAVGVTEKTMTGVVDRMVRSSYVERFRDPQDRRVVRVKLTRRGQAIHRKLDGLVRKKVTAMLRLIDPVDRAELFRIYTQLRDRMLASESAEGEAP